MTILLKKQVGIFPTPVPFTNERSTFPVFGDRG